MKFTRDIPDYGDIFEINEWHDCVKEGYFMDSDGSGNFAKNGKMTECCGDNVCDLFTIAEATKQGATHIVWFNK